MAAAVTEARKGTGESRVACEISISTVICGVVFRVTCHSSHCVTHVSRTRHCCRVQPCPPRISAAVFTAANPNPPPSPLPPWHNIPPPLSLVPPPLRHDVCPPAHARVPPRSPLAALSSPESNNPPGVHPHDRRCNNRQAHACTDPACSLLACAAVDTAGGTAAAVDGQRRDRSAGVGVAGAGRARLCGELVWDDYERHRAGERGGEDCGCRGGGGGGAGGEGEFRMWGWWGGSGIGIYGDIRSGRADSYVELRLIYRCCSWTSCPLFSKTISMVRLSALSLRTPPLYSRAF